MSKFKFIADPEKFQRDAEENKKKEVQEIKEKNESTWKTFAEVMHVIMNSRNSQFMGDWRFDPGTRRSDEMES